MFASYPLIHLGKKYKSQGFGFNYLEKNRSDIVTTIAAGEAEVGLMMMPSVGKEKWLALFKAQGIEYSQITLEQPYALVGPNSELYSDKYTEFTPKLLANREMIIFPEGNELFRSINREIFKKFSPASYIRVCDRGTLVSVLSQTDGYYLGTHNKKAYRIVSFYSNTRIKPIVDIDFSYEIGYIKQSDRSLSPIVQEYLQMITDMIV